MNASAAGDRIEVQPGSYVGDETAIRHDLTIVGVSRPTITWTGGVGPYLQVFGSGTKAHIEGLNLVGNGVNTSLIGDRQQVYGYPPTGANQVIRLVDLSLSNTGGGAIFAWSPGVNYEILGGVYDPSLWGSQTGTLVMASSLTGPARMSYVVPGSNRIWMENALVSQSVHLNGTDYESIGFSAVQFSGQTPYFLTGYPNAGTDYSSLVPNGTGFVTVASSIASTLPSVATPNTATDDWSAFGVAQAGGLAAVELVSASHNGTGSLTATAICPKGKVVFSGSCSMTPPTVRTFTDAASGEVVSLRVGTISRCEPASIEVDGVTPVTPNAWMAETFNGLETYTAKVTASCRASGD